MKRLALFRKHVAGLLWVGKTEVDCIVSTDDEAFTYNKRINRLTTIQEHRMILKAVARSVPEDRIAKALNVNVSNIRQKLHLLDGVCEEAANPLKDKHVPINVFWSLKKMSSLRQIEAAELMVAMNKYTISYAKSLLAATAQDQLKKPDQPKPFKGLTADQTAAMECESSSLDRQFRAAEKSYASDHLDLTLANSYLFRLLNNPRVEDFLGQHQPDLMVELQKLNTPQAEA